jgi:hypothetical protein
VATTSPAATRGGKQRTSQGKQGRKRARTRSGGEGRSCASSSGAGGIRPRARLLEPAPAAASPPLPRSHSSLSTSARSRGLRRCPPCPSQRPSYACVSRSPVAAHCTELSYKPRAWETGARALPSGRPVRANGARGSDSGGASRARRALYKARRIGAKRRAIFLQRVPRWRGDEEKGGRRCVAGTDRGRWSGSPRALTPSAPRDTWDSAILTRAEAALRGVRCAPPRGRRGRFCQSVARSVLPVWTAAIETDEPVD